MADREILSQEEIDALLNTVEAEEKSTDEGAPPDSQKAHLKNNKAENDFSEINPEQVQVLNFTNQERTVRGELPVLDKIHDRAARFFANDIYQLMAKDLQIKQEALSIVKHREFLGSLPNPTLMTIRRFKPLRGKALILFDSTFVYDLVDYYFGGSSQFLAQKSRTDFTATELRVMEIVIGKLVRCIEQAWAPIIKLEAIKVGDETNPQLVHIGEPNEVLLVSRFNVDFGKESGAFYFVIPYSMVEPIKQQLELGAARPDDEIDPNWVMSLKEELMDVELVVSSVMAQTNSTLGKVMSWQVGDFIPLEMNEVVTLDIEGTPGFTATIGSANDKRAVKIIKKISY
ncbi:flagellar motor switch protein FliM [Legionella micdadei]|uniref:Flagellar motor switch protein FliM n=1 Tax=Legionella micdadei TaxID=451 RepID=A0A098GD45_LEGMI|nr:flagellar motor switch protein FliM [Legionella micdadei]ARG97970.1 flagellar motor switch protein FliM [Legionella micdadei]ARG99711.1 flagellar motor switch protein FliM [Legionella micdadei]KTD30233.1 flagellar protein [Legionella micdadei]NSL19225.1 flagellar motor switch protein FliM [Legionella micdadei]CEG60408.1 Flagellar motor switch protein FliM [Legionella micdadei]